MNKKVAAEPEILPRLTNKSVKNYCNVCLSHKNFLGMSVGNYSVEASRNCCLVGS
jgi:hypothetical protein